jgi:hypothetical protein
MNLGAQTLELFGRLTLKPTHSQKKQKQKGPDDGIGRE